MNGYARITLLGNICKDFEFRDAPDGSKTYAQTSVAVNGGTKEAPTVAYYDITTSVKSDLHGKFLQDIAKGTPVFVDGDLKIKTVQTQKGDVKIVQVYINKIQPFSRPPQQGQQQAQGQAPQQPPPKKTYTPPAQRQPPPPPPQEEGGFGDTEPVDDIPFK